MTANFNRDKHELKFDNSKTAGLWDPSIKLVFQDLRNLTTQAKEALYASTQILSLSGHEIERDDVVNTAELINQFDNLKTLNLNGCHLIPKKITRLIKHNKSEDKFERIKLLSEHVNANDKVEELDLSGNEINEERLMLLTTLVSKFKNLKYLHLNDNDLNPECVRSFCQEISRSNRYLCEISLYENSSIKQKDITGINETLSERYQKNKQEDRKNGIPRNAVNVMARIGVLANISNVEQQPNNNDINSPT